MIFRTEDVYFIDCPFWSRELLVPKAIHKWWFQISPSLIAHRRIPQKNPFPSALWRTSPTKLNTHYSGKKLKFDTKSVSSLLSQFSVQNLSFPLIWKKYFNFANYSLFFAQKLIQRPRNIFSVSILSKETSKKTFSSKCR